MALGASSKGNSSMSQMFTQNRATAPDNNLPVIQAPQPMPMPNLPQQQAAPQQQAPNNVFGMMGPFASKLSDPRFGYTAGRQAGPQDMQRARAFFDNRPQQPPQMSEAARLAQAMNDRFR